MSDVTIFYCDWWCSVKPDNTLWVQEIILLCFKHYLRTGKQYFWLLLETSYKITLIAWFPWIHCKYFYIPKLISLSICFKKAVLLAESDIIVVNNSTPTCTYCDAKVNFTFEALLLHKTWNRWCDFLYNCCFIEYLHFDAIGKCKLMRFAVRSVATKA